MTDEQRKILAEFLEYKRDKSDKYWVDDRNRIHYLCQDEDMLSLMRMLAETNNWKNACVYLENSFMNEFPCDCICEYCEDFMFWIISDPARTCNLIAEFLEGRE
jgi:hypothetical protein